MAARGAAPIRFVDRASGTICEEVVYGARALEIAYTTMAGRLALPLITARWLSRLYGWMQDRPSSRAKIQGFVTLLDLDPMESEFPPDAYPTFNAFFTRRLKPERRPLAADPRAFSSPADARLAVHAPLDPACVTPIKGVPYTLAELLGADDQAARYAGGALLSFRLCPADYHRYHFPVDGTPGAARDLPGALYSVNPLAFAAGHRIFVRNHRQVIALDATPAGDLAIVPIGATFVGAIHASYVPGVRVRRGDEMGYFSFGGSSLIVLVPRERVAFDEDLLENTRAGLETRVRFGEALGTIA